MFTGNKGGHIGANCSAQKNVPFLANLKSILQKPKEVSVVEPDEGEESATELPTGQEKE